MVRPALQSRPVPAESARPLKRKDAAYEVNSARGLVWSMNEKVGSDQKLFNRCDHRTDINQSLRSNDVQILDGHPFRTTRSKRERPIETGSATVHRPLPGAGYPDGQYRRPPLTIQQIKEIVNDPAISSRGSGADRFDGRNFVPFFIAMRGDGFDRQVQLKFFYSVYNDQPLPNRIAWVQRRHLKRVRALSTVGGSPAAGVYRFRLMLLPGFALSRSSGILRIASWLL